VQLSAQQVIIMGYKNVLCVVDVTVCLKMTKRYGNYLHQISFNFLKVFIGPAYVNRWKRIHVLPSDIGVFSVLVVRHRACFMFWFRALSVFSFLVSGTECVFCFGCRHGACFLFWFQKLSVFSGSGTECAFCSDFRH
jgi:hypothetical protein